MLTNQFDLVDSVYRIICERVPNQGARFIQHFSNTCAVTRQHHGDLIALNHYWRLELGVLAGDTISERECLTTDCTLEVWLSNFQRYVLPRIIREDLPRLST